MFKEQQLKKKDEKKRQPRDRQEDYINIKNFEKRNQKSLKETTSRTQGHIPQAEKQEEEKLF